MAHGPSEGAPSEAVPPEAVLAEELPGTGRNTLGIALMVGSMALFAVTDMAVKLASDGMSQFQTLFVLGLGGTLVFASLALVRGQRIFVRAAAHPTVIGRNIVEVCGTSSMVAALALTPLVVVGAILQAAPLAVMAGGALLLGERVGWRRWAAALLGFAGVLVVLRPWSAGLAPGALLAVVAMLCLSARDIFNRRAPRSLPTTVLALHATVWMCSVGAIGALAGPGRLLPVDPPWGLIAVMMICGSGAYFSITASVRAAPVSVVAPFRYTRLLFLGGLGIVFLSETADLAVLIGSALIVASGLYALSRERRATLHSRATAP